MWTWRRDAVPEHQEVEFGGLECLLDCPGYVQYLAPEPHRVVIGKLGGLRDVRASPESDHIPEGCVVPVQVGVHHAAFIDAQSTAGHARATLGTDRTPFPREPSFPVLWPGAPDVSGRDASLW
jgi:hypothetical protein